MTVFQHRMKVKTERELDTLRRWLAALRRETGEADRDPPGDNTPFSEETEATQAVEEKEIRYEILSRLSLHARNLEQALDRIRSGTYGLCASCHGPIHRERLEALPETEVCLKCQLRLEEDEAPQLLASKWS